MKKVMVLNGPNLNLLGIRNSNIYGTFTLEDIKNELTLQASRLNMEIDFFQSNHEGEIIDTIHSCKNKYDVLIINPGAYTHYSISIRDAIESIGITTIEVHLSNIFAREKFRSTSVISPVCAGHISGFGMLSYSLAVDAAHKLLNTIVTQPCN